MTSNASLTDELMGQLQGIPMQGLAQQLGLDSVQTEQAVGVALPMLFGALGQNASQPQGAADLLGGLLGGAGAAGGLGSILGSVLGGGAGGGSAGGSQLDVGAILGSIFGDQQQQVESKLGQTTGLGGSAAQLLALLAPLVMSFLAKRADAQGSDLGNALGHEQSSIQSQGGMAGGLLGSLLDQNGDGKLDTGDLLKFGASLLGGKR